jgi:hypothetical protein
MIGDTPGCQPSARAHMYVGWPRSSPYATKLPSASDFSVWRGTRSPSSNPSNTIVAPATPVPSGSSTRPYSFERWTVTGSDLLPSLARPAEAGVGRGLSVPSDCFELSSEVGLEPVRPSSKNIAQAATARASKRAIARSARCLWSLILISLRIHSPCEAGMCRTRGGAGIAMLLGSAESAEPPMYSMTPATTARLRRVAATTLPKHPHAATDLPNSKTPSSANAATQEIFSASRARVGEIMPEKSSTARVPSRPMRSHARTTPAVPPVTVVDTNSMNCLGFSAFTTASVPHSTPRPTTCAAVSHHASLSWAGSYWALTMFS